MQTLISALLVFISTSIDYLVVLNNSFCQPRNPRDKIYLYRAIFRDWYISRGKPHCCLFPQLYSSGLDDWVSRFDSFGFGDSFDIC